MNFENPEPLKFVTPKESFVTAGWLSPTPSLISATTRLRCWCLQSKAWNY